MERIVDMPMYRGEATLRHATALQKTADNPAPAIHLHPDSLPALALANGQNAILRSNGGETILPVVADSRVATGCFYIPAGFPETAGVALRGEFSVSTGENP